MLRILLLKSNRQRFHLLRMLKHFCQPPGLYLILISDDSTMKQLLLGILFYVDISRLILRDTYTVLCVCALRMWTDVFHCVDCMAMTRCQNSSRNHRQCLTHLNGAVHLR